MIEERARFEVLLETIQSNFRVFGDKLTALSDAYEQTNVRLDRVETKLDRTEMRLDVFSRETNEQLDRLGTKVDKLETKVDKLEGFAVDAQGRFKKLEGFAADAQGRLKRIETHLELNGTSSPQGAQAVVRRNRGGKSRGRG